MKKIFLFAAVVAAVACAKEAPQTSVENPVVVVTPAEEGEAMPVAFGTNLTASVTVKSQGGVDAWDATQKLYVYGF